MEEFFYSEFSPAGKIIEKLVHFYVPKKAGQKSPSPPYKNLHLNI